jgi:hypothetical protein
MRPFPRHYAAPPVGVITENDQVQLSAGQNSINYDFRISRPQE